MKVCKHCRGFGLNFKDIGPRVVEKRTCKKCSGTGFVSEGGDGMNIIHRLHIILARVFGRKYYL